MKKLNPIHVSTVEIFPQGNGYRWELQLPDGTLRIGVAKTEDDAKADWRIIFEMLVNFV